MPRLSVVYIKLGLLYLLVGFTLGALLLTNKGIPLWGGVWAFLPAHIDFLLFGWTVQLIFGVAYWILPRMPGGARGSPGLPWLALGLLNLGIWLSSFHLLFDNREVLLLSGRLLQTLAFISFAAHAWKRVRPTVLPNPKQGSNTDS
jgi:hypothetical protein